MSDQHASRSFRSKAPRGTRHNGPDPRGVAGRSDPSVYARLAADVANGGKGKKALKMLQLAKNKEARDAFKKKFPNSKGTKP